MLRVIFVNKNNLNFIKILEIEAFKEVLNKFTYKSTFIITILFTKVNTFNNFLNKLP
jgi:hypothetical protein